jgi:arginine exporter protein ArgO
MGRCLAGIGAGLIAGAVAAVFTASEPWWLIAGAVAAAVVWFGQLGVEALADALDDLF